MPVMLEIVLSRIHPFKDGVNPWPLCRLRVVEGGTAGALAALRLTYESETGGPATSIVALSMTAEQARIVADLLYEAAEMIERSTFRA